MASLCTDQRPPRRHVLVVNFPAYGHMIPLLELSKKISQFHDVTFAVSSFMVTELTKRELLHKSDIIQMHPIQDGLVLDYSNDDVGGGLARVFQLYLPAVNKLLREVPSKGKRNQAHALQPIDVVICDFFIAQEMVICHERGIPFYIFNPGNIFMTQFLLMFDENYPSVPDNIASPFSRLPEPGKPLLPIGEKKKQVFLPMKGTIPATTGIIVNSVRDIEREGVQAVEQDPAMTGRKVYCVGPLLPDPNIFTSSAELSLEENVAQWLDGQKPNTVIFVSFGSITTPTPDQLAVIAQALLTLKCSFIWALREKQYSALPEEITGKVDSQFQSPNSKFLLLNWAPQKVILAHAAVAMFVSHCGWNSALEGLSNGKPIISWPMFGDQLSTAEHIVKLGAGVLVPDTSIECRRLVTAQEIQDLVEEVGGWKAGKVSAYRENAGIWKEKIDAAWAIGGSSYTEFFDLIQFGS